MTSAFRFRDRRISSVVQLPQRVRDDERRLGEQPKIWYRGLTDVAYQLLPTLHRLKIPVDREMDLMNRFKKNAHQFLDQRPQGEWEWMLIMRHHGLPSRLMDWTESPLIGFYFSVFEEPPTGGNQDETDSVLWCLLPTQLNDFASGGLLPADVVPMFSDEREISTHDEFLENYRPSRVSRLTSQEKVPPAAAISICTTKRIQAQQGVFTIHHSHTTPLEAVGDGSHIWRYLIPAECKMQIREELRRLGVNRLTIFPELDNVAQEAIRGS